jgi:hypothetical protein
VFGGYWEPAGKLWGPCLSSHRSIGARHTTRQIQIHLRKGTGMLKVAELVGVGTGTVQRIKAEMETSGPFDVSDAA